jgi:outer membrane protein OmpA-like peptidoglycan-associated protein
MMAPRFARHVAAVAPRGLAAVAFALMAAALIAPQTAQAQRHQGSVSVDLSVLDALGGAPRNVPQMLRPAVRSLLMPNAGRSGIKQRGYTRFAPAAPAMPRAGLAPVASGFQLEPPSQMRRAATARPVPTKSARPRALRKPVMPRARPPAPPVIMANPPTAPRAPSIPAVPQSASAPPLPVAPPQAPPATLATRPAPAAPTQTAALTSSASPRGKLAAGQQFRLMFGAGAAAVENAAGTQLDDIATALKTNETLRLQLLAYSGDGTQTPSQARRMSLSRALAVRSRLIKEGVRRTRIDVRALGNKSEGGPPDRVDVIVTKR